MKDDIRRRGRRSIRLKGYDYARAGAYFVTMVTQDRARLFGQLEENGMRLNDGGRAVQRIWDEIPTHYPGVDIDAFVVMPDHVHGIILLTGDGRAGPKAPLGHPPSTGLPSRGHPPSTALPSQGHPPSTALLSQGHPRGGAPNPRGVAPTSSTAPTLSLADVVQRFKTMTMKLYSDGVRQLGWKPYRGRLWQRNYYERIIRDDAALNRVRQYIARNPTRRARYRRKGRTMRKNAR